MPTTYSNLGYIWVNICRKSCKIHGVMHKTIVFRFECSIPNSYPMYLEPIWRYCFWDMVSWLVYVLCRKTQNNPFSMFKWSHLAWSNDPLHWKKNNDHQIATRAVWIWLGWWKLAGRTLLVPWWYVIIWWQSVAFYNISSEYPWQFEEDDLYYTPV